MSHWRVIAQRRNGQQRIIDEHISREAAEKLVETLRALSLFPAVYVEMDEKIASSFEIEPAGAH